MSVLRSPIKQGLRATHASPTVIKYTGRPNSNLSLAWLGMRQVLFGRIRLHKNSFQSLFALTKTDVAGVEIMMSVQNSHWKCERLALLNDGSDTVHLSPTTPRINSRTSLQASDLAEQSTVRLRLSSPMTSWFAIIKIKTSQMTFHVAHSSWRWSSPAYHQARGASIENISNSFYKQNNDCGNWLSGSWP